MRWQVTPYFIHFDQTLVIRISYFHNVVVQYKQHKQGAMYRYERQCSASVPCVDLFLLYNDRLEKLLL